MFSILVMCITRSISVIIFVLFSLSATLTASEKLNPENLLSSELEIKELFNKYIETDNNKDRDEIKNRIIAKENNPEKLKELYINSIQHTQKQYGIHEKHLKINNIKEKYFLYIPKGYKPNKSYPLVVSLHGVGEGGIAFMGRWLRHSDHKQEYIFLCPHYTSGYWWEKNGEELVLNSIKQVCAEQNIDTNRIYLTGFSSGAHGVWYLAIRSPDIFAGIVPVAGECVIPGQIKNLRYVPAFIIHGKRDGVIPIEAAIDVRDRLKSLEYTYKYVELPNQKHAYPLKENNEILEWFKSIKKSSRPKEFCFLGNVSDKKSIYWLVIDESVNVFDLPDTTHDNTKQNSNDNDTNSFNLPAHHNIEIKIVGNKIVVKADNISKFTLFFDKKLIEVTKPCKVIVNGKQQFTGTIKPDADSFFSSINSGFRTNNVFTRSVQLRGD